MSESIIQIQHLSKTFGDGTEAVHALEDINLDILQGEIFGIIGLSGAGKSTLVRCMNLLERPTSGTVVVDGQNMTELSEKALRLARRKITMIFQSFNLLMQRTCLKNVCFPMEISGVPAAQARRRAAELLEIVGLRDKADAYPAQLSGGQKQRSSIARALLKNAPILILDDALSAVDTDTEEHILHNLKENRAGKTTILIAHRISTIQHADLILVLEDGAAAEIGNHDSLMEADGIYREMFEQQQLEAAFGEAHTAEGGVLS